MKIEQIVSYLMVSTVIVIFAMLVLYTMMDSVGNGGEYWGYDGREDPRWAARDAFRDGDHRFLDVALPPYDDLLTDFVPGITVCAGGTGDYEPGLRRSLSEPLHAELSLRAATEFATEFNRELGYALGDDRLAYCYSAPDQ